MCFRKRNRMKRTNRFNSEQGRRSDKEIGYNRNWLFLLGLRIWVDYLLKCTGGILLQNVNFSHHQARHVSSQEPCYFIVYESVGLKKEILSIWQWIIVEEVMAGLLLVTSFEQETGSWWPENDIKKRCLRGLRFRGSRAHDHWSRVVCKELGYGARNVTRHSF